MNRILLCCLGLLPVLASAASSAWTGRWRLDAAQSTALDGWLDDGRTLRIEAQVPLEISQGETVMRLYSECRLLEGDQALLLIELHSSRPRPLVYRFINVPGEAAKK